MIDEHLIPNLHRPQVLERQVVLHPVPHGGLLAGEVVEAVGGRPRPPEDRRVGRGEEQPGAQALAVDEGWGSGARLSYRRRESRGRRGGGYSSGVSRSQAKGPETRGGRPEGRRDTAAAGAARRD